MCVYVWLQLFCFTDGSTHLLLLLLLLLLRSFICWLLCEPDVMWCDVMWCDVMWCDVMWCDVIVLIYGGKWQVHSSLELIEQMKCTTIQKKMKRRKREKNHSTKNTHHHTPHTTQTATNGFSLTYILYAHGLPTYGISTIACTKEEGGTKWKVYSIKMKWS